MVVAKELAEFICKNKYSDFDSAVVKHTKNLILSGIGMTLAGSKMRAGQAMINYVRECGAPPEAGVMGAGFRTSAEYAALANGSTSHATEYEDVGFPEVIYTCAIFPVALALGEKLGLSGKDIIQLNVMGYEVQSSLSLTCLAASKRGFQIASIFGCIGAAAMTAKALGLGVDETIMALSLAASQACGLQQQTGTGGHLYESGLCGRNGISAAVLAKYGLTGRPDIFEIPGGFCDAVAGTTGPKITLGEFRIRNCGYKNYPCCFLQQNAINGVLELIEEHDISADDVDSIRADISPALARAVRYQHPANDEEARFSLPHSIAACFLDKEITLDCYTEEKARDKRYHEFREKVTLVVHPEWERPGLSGADVPIVIRLKNGKEYQKICPSTDVALFLSDEEIMANYMERACRVLSRRQAEKAARLVLTLEEAKDISELMGILTFPKKQ